MPTQPPQPVPSPPETPELGVSLTEAELETLLDIALGLTDRAIGVRRNLSTRGVQNRLKSLYIKLGIDQEQFQSDLWGVTFNSRARALRTALLQGLISDRVIAQASEALDRWLGEHQAVAEG